MILNTIPFPWLGVALWIVVGGGVVTGGWMITRRVPAPWLRILARAIITALTFTPVTIHPIGRLGEFTMPAWYAHYSLAASDELNVVYLLMINFQVGFATVVLWTLGMLISSLSRALRWKVSETTTRPGSGAQP